MKIKGQLIKVFVIFFFYVFSLQAQSVTAPENNREIFRTSIELFNAENYGAALFGFQKLRERSEPGSAFADEADYFIRVCYLEMGNSNGRMMLEKYIAENPESSRINNAYYRLGNADFNQKRYTKALASFKKIDRYALSGKELDE